MVKFGNHLLAAEILKIPEQQLEAREMQFREQKLQAEDELIRKKKEMDDHDWRQANLQLHSGPINYAESVMTPEQKEAYHSRKLPHTIILSRILGNVRDSHLSLVDLQDYEYVRELISNKRFQQELKKSFLEVFDRIGAQQIRTPDHFDMRRVYMELLSTERFYVIITSYVLQEIQKYMDMLKKNSD